MAYISPLLAEVFRRNPGFKERLDAEAKRIADDLWEVISGAVIEAQCTLVEDTDERTSGRDGLAERASGGTARLPTLSAGAVLGQCDDSGDGGQR